MAWSTPRTWVTNEIVTAAHMNQEVRDNLNAVFPDEETTNVWTPTLSADVTPPTYNNVEGAEYQMGAVGIGWVKFSDFTSAGSGAFELDLPAPAVNLSAGGFGPFIGYWGAHDASAPVNTEFGFVGLVDSTTVRFRRLAGGQTVVNHNVPFGWAAFDSLVVQLQWPLA